MFYVHTGPDILTSDDATIGINQQLTQKHV